MKNIFYLLLGFVFFVSCTSSESEDVCDSPDYSDCITAQPFEGTMNVKVTINNENSYVPLTIYVGDMADHFIYLKDTADASFYSVDLPVGYFYTITAHYKKGTDNIIAVDGDDVKATKSTYCDSTCWTINQGNVNLKLKK
ncbi:MAG: hypothetical protein V2A54_10175 [Bacteroidota bacterium]